MIDNVAIFGDSFNYGHGCKDRMFYYDENTKQMVGEKPPEGKPSAYCWGSLLQQKYPDIKVYNFAGPGRSNQQIFRDFLKYCETNPEDKQNNIVFFQMTNPDRIEILKGSNDIMSYVLSNAATHNDHVGQTVREYVKNMYHPSIGENIGFMTMMAAFGLAKLQKIYRFYWTCSKIAYPQDTYHFLTLPYSDLKRQNIEDIRNFKFSERVGDEIDLKHRAPDGHVNDLGHQVYFDQVIDPIIKQHL